MILGEFGPTGQPFIDGYLTLPRFGIARNITFLVDPGAYATCVHPRDGTLAAIPFDRLDSPVTSNGVGGPATYFMEPAVLEFVDGEAREIRSYEVDVLIAKPAADPTHSTNRLPSLWQLHTCVHHPSYNLPAVRHRQSSPGQQRCWVLL